MKTLFKLVLIPLIFAGLFVWAMFGVLDGGTATRNSFVWLIGIIIALIIADNQYSHIRFNEELKRLQEMFKNIIH